MKKLNFHLNKICFGTIIIVSTIALNSCACNVRVTEDKITSSEKITDGFQISRITVEVISENGIPQKYSADTTVVCGPYCMEYANELEYKIINGENAKFVDTCNFKASRTIYLHKSNKNYVWWFFKPYEPKQDYHTFPIKFIPGVWYELKNVCSPYDFVFIYVKDNGDLEIKHIEKY